jgi:hypothetical protein
MKIKNNYDALVFGLKLLIIAPDDKSEECFEIVKSLASTLSKDEVLRAKAQVEVEPLI